MKVKEGNSLKLSLSNWKIVSTRQILASFNIIREASIHVVSAPRACWTQQSSGEKIRRQCIQGDDCKDEGRGWVPVGHKGGTPDSEKLGRLPGRENT